MKKNILKILPLLFIFANLFLVCPLLSQNQENKSVAISLQDSFASVAEKFKPLVVSVTGKKEVLQPIRPYRFYYGSPFDPFGDDFFQESFPGKNKQQYLKRKFEGGGSGVVVSSDGYILTNYHVISFADDITVHFAEKNKVYEAKLIAKDSQTDLAIIKIVSNETFEYAKLGDSDKLRVGDWVIAIGSPFGLEQTLTAGIVSARRQSLDIEGKRYENMIQTDAAINRGNSGGPLVNIYGEVIGINTAIYAPTGVFSGIGFAIPINKAFELIKSARNETIVNQNKREEKTSQAMWNGIIVENISQSNANFYKLNENEKGVVVTGIDYKQLSVDFGLMTGDVIKGINRQAIENTDDFEAVTKKISNGDISINAVRNGLPLYITHLERKR